MLHTGSRGLLGRPGVLAAAVLPLLAGLLLAGAAGASDLTAPARRSPALDQLHMARPMTTFHPEIKAGADSLHLWSSGAAKAASDRHELYQAIRRGLRQCSAYGTRMAATYPPGGISWLLMTDAVADTFTTLASPLLQAYAKAHPDELLTDGRQKLELILSRILGPPPRLLGFHFVRMAGFVYGKADSLAGSGATQDIAGLEDGVLRTLKEWAGLYDQVHSDPIAILQSRTNQEDYIIGRLVDRCGNSGAGVWRLLEQWTAAVGQDSSKTPPEDRMAHEYHLLGLKCPEDTLVIYIDLPNYQEVQEEVMRKQKESGAPGQPAMRGRGR
jgi:hypothetical protein